MGWHPANGSKYGARGIEVVVNNKQKRPTTVTFMVNEHYAPAEDKDKRPAKTIRNDAMMREVTTEYSEEESKEAKSH